MKASHPQTEQPKGGGAATSPGPIRTIQPIDVVGFRQWLFDRDLAGERGEIAVTHLHLNGMGSEAAVLEQRLAKTRAINQGVMRELLTGRIRLP